MKYYSIHTFLLIIISGFFLFPENQAAQTHPYFLNPGFYRNKEGDFHIKIAPRGRIFFGEKDLSSPSEAEYTVFSSIRTSYQLTLKPVTPEPEKVSDELSAALPVTLPSVLEPKTAESYQFTFSRDSSILTVYLMKKNVPYRKLVLERYKPL